MPTPNKPNAKAALDRRFEWRSSKAMPFSIMAIRWRCWEVMRR